MKERRGRIGWKRQEKKVRNWLVFELKLGDLISKPEERKTK